MSRMRVALDARRYQDRPIGGVGRALDGIVDLLAQEVDLVLVTDARRDPPPTALPCVALSAPRGAPEVVWLQRSLVTWLRSFDGIFHGTFNQLPYRFPVPGVVSIHDLSFELHPEGFSRSKRIVFQLQARHAARVARRVITGSEFAKSELVERYRLPPDRVLVSPIGVDPLFDPSLASDAGAVCDRLGVSGRYIVAMGGARRRGLEVALGALRRVREHGLDITLVVIGSEVPPSEPGVVHAGPVDDHDWAALLAGAAAFCYPTRYEGFGVPALESISSGTPIVCAPIASLPEVLGEAAEWCATPTVDSISEGLLRVLDNPARATELRTLGLAQVAALPTWEYAAEVTLQAYRAAQPD